MTRHAESFFEPGVARHAKKQSFIFSKNQPFSLRMLEFRRVKSPWGDHKKLKYCIRKSFREMLENVQKPQSYDTDQNRGRGGLAVKI